MQGLTHDGGVPSFSVVICADGGVNALRNTLRSLDYLDYPNFEVCVIHGPTSDGVAESLARYVGRIKVAHNPSCNLSIARNIGLALASGQIIAYLDDDTIPEPEWLRDLATAYATPCVGGAGGFVYGATGADVQFRYGTVDRLARPTRRNRPTLGLCFPLTANFPHVLSANCSFRREALLAVGGFDEEYDDYLAETDATVRVVDADWTIAQIEGAYVHHKGLRSTMRHEVASCSRVARQWYSMIKNKIYFCLRHGQRSYGLNSVIEEVRAFIAVVHRDIQCARDQGYLNDMDERCFWEEVDQAWLDGLTRGLADQPHLVSEDTLRTWASPFLPFGAVPPAGGRRVFCYVSQEYTVGKMGGIGRYTHELAEATAAMGHHVHVITRSQDDDDRVDFERGVWVHRIADRPAHGDQPGRLKMPWYRWGRAVTVLETIDGINAKHRVDAVSAPIWDCEGVALIGRYPLVTSLHTSMAPWLAANPLRAKDRKFLREHARPVIAAETYVLNHSDRVVANSHAILDELKQFYDIQIAPDLISFIPHGLSDWTALLREAPPDLPEGSLRLVFIGRLEERKGIDVLLCCVPRLLARHPHVHLDLVGDDTIPGPKGRPWRQICEVDPRFADLGARVVFHGVVSDELLRGFYAAADIFVAPSRFESFGLTLLEGMMFGKPVVGGRAGGMVEVVEHGVTGLLAEPGDAASLEACLERLIDDPVLRACMGTAARARYEEHFSVEGMTTAHVAAMNAAAGHFGN